jgi:hypothetical protein
MLNRQQEGMTHLSIYDVMLRKMNFGGRPSLRHSRMIPSGVRSEAMGVPDSRFSPEAYEPLAQRHAGMTTLLSSFANHQL